MLVDLLLDGATASESRRIRCVSMTMMTWGSSVWPRGAQLWRSPDQGCAEPGGGDEDCRNKTFKHVALNLVPTLKRKSSSVVEIFLDQRDAEIDDERDRRASSGDARAHRQARARRSSTSATGSCPVPERARPSAKIRPLIWNSSGNPKGKLAPPCRRSTAGRPASLSLAASRVRCRRTRSRGRWSRR